MQGVIDIPHSYSFTENLYSVFSGIANFCRKFLTTLSLNLQFFLNLEHNHVTNLSHVHLLHWLAQRVSSCSWVRFVRFASLESGARHRCSIQTQRVSSCLLEANIESTCRVSRGFQILDPNLLARATLLERESNNTSRRSRFCNQAVGLFSFFFPSVLWHDCALTVHYVKQLNKMILFFTGECAFGHDVRELASGVNVFDLHVGVHIDSVQQPVKRNSVGSWHAGW